MSNLLQIRGEQLRQARLVFIQTLGLNLLVAIAKLVLGYTTATLTMIADGFHSLLDASANIVGIIGITVSLKPPDKEHPYGHRKFEALAAIVISFFMFLASFEVLSEAVRRFSSGSTEIPEVTGLSYLVMLVTMVINFAVSKYEQRKGRLLRNKLLIADSKHTFSDVFVSATVLSTLVAIQLKMPLVDMLAAVFVVLFILRAGFQIVLAQVGTLVDEAVFDPKYIERLVLEVPGVTSCHKIRSRGVDDHVFIDLHVQVPRDLSIEQAHKICFAVEEHLNAAIEGYADVLVHVEDDAPPWENSEEAR